MNEDQILIVDTTKRILNDYCGKNVVDAAESGEWAGDLWQAFETAGLSLANVPESLNGSGGQFSDSLLIIREAAKYAAPIPLADTLIASTLLTEVNAQVPNGPIGLGIGELNFIEDPKSVHVLGRVDALAFGNECDHWLLVGDQQLCLVSRQTPSDMVDVQTHRNLAGEPYVTVLFNKNVAGAGLYAYPNAMMRAQQLGAITRVQLMSGAMSSMLELSVQYALERVQFGRPISQFQAIQQQLAILAGEVAASQRAADSLLNDPGIFNTAVSKSRVGDAVAPVSEIAHQVHGAMGYTREHALNLRSRRLWVWRDEYGEEVYWQQRLGADLCMSGADSLWERICDAG
ncbi:MAG: acyl-CoA dehydrogenase [Candidatus Azotimanducaceae bacterium]|jgi:acyl-CoA dehydrogenase